MLGSNNPHSGLRLATQKAGALARPIVSLAAPSHVVLALDQGSGRAAEPVVRVGDEVAIGTLVAEAAGPEAAALHAPVAGRIVALETRAAATVSREAPCLVIRNDGSGRVDASMQPVGDYATLPPAELVDRLRGAGIAGLGGAGFPTATKLAAGREREARVLLVNAAECEPWICSDDALMREDAADVVAGVRVLMHALGATDCIVALEDDKPQAAAALRQALAPVPAEEFRIDVLPAVYPQGAERQLVTAVTGREVPSGGLPADVGVTCQNVGTVAAVGRWVRTGEPCLSRVVTVTGSGVAQPCNVRASIGTPLADLVAAAGGYVGEPLRLIGGGSLTGRALATDEVGLTKAMNCLLVATRADLESREGAFELPCIRCGDCATVCPATLLPQQLHRAAVADDEAGLLTYGLWDCIDCGCCDYVCPSQIPLAWRFRLARRRLAERDAVRARAAEAREQYERRQRRLADAAAEERAAFEDARRQARQDGPTSGEPAGEP